MWRLLSLAFLVIASALPGACQQQVLPQGIIPGPEEPGIAVHLETDKESYAPGEYLTVRFTLSQEAWVYLYDVRPDGTVELLVPNRFLQEPRFPAGEHVLPTEGWRLRVTEPEGMEYLEIIATDRPLSFYDAKAFEEHPFLAFADPGAFASRLRELLVGAWGAAWTRFRVHRPVATLHIFTDPPGAVAWADGELLGTTPLEDQVTPGMVTVRLEKPGYKEEDFTLSLVDGEELELTVTLEKAPPPSRNRPSLGGGGIGGALGAGAVGLELWGQKFALGLAVKAPGEAPPAGSGGWYPWGPEFELYAIGWAPVGEGELALVGLLGVAMQEWAWYPSWQPEGLLPLLVPEPETELRAWATFGLGLGAELGKLKVYLLWHTHRGPVLGIVLNP